MFKSILVPVDLSETARNETVIRQAGELARQHGAAVRFVAVLAPVQPSVAAYLPAGAHQRAVDDVSSELKKLVEASGLGDKASYAVREGVVYHEILTDAEENKIDLIVMGSHRPEMATYLFGSNAAHVVRHAECSVLVLR